jgi:LPPG:FO 2-phospho-L-lactate transferase
MSAGPKIVALCGGIGGAKLALGLERRFGERVTVIVNTGDDFEHLGLRISPDIDTVLYTLGGLNDRERGWGRADETWHFMESLRQMGGETWFKLGDRDLAMHVERTQRLRAGVSLTEFTTVMAKRFGIVSAIVPMSDEPVATVVHTDEGLLPFQCYFVQRRCEPVVRRVVFENALQARPSPAALAALRDRNLAAVVICPSNPFLSVDPILAVPQLRDAIRNAEAPVVAVSPLIGGLAVKGPTTKIMAELSLDAGPSTIAQHYKGLIDGLIIDHADREASVTLPVPFHVTATLMTTLRDKDRLAEECVAFAGQIAQSVQRRDKRA